MTPSSRLRVPLGLAALALVLTACGGAEPEESPTTSPAPATTAAASTAPAPRTPSSPARTTTSAPASPERDAASASSVEAAGAGETPAGSSATTDAPASASARATAAGEAETSGPAPTSSRAAQRTATGGSGEGAEDTGRPSSPAPSTRAASTSTAAPTRTAEPPRTTRPAPVAAEAPASADLGGPKAGVAPADTPVAVASTAPPVVEKVSAAEAAPKAPPAPKPAPSAPAAAPSARPSASAAATSPAPAPASPTAPAAHADPVAEPDVDCRVTRCIALTFDDGPGRHTGRLLDLLSEEEVPATFYVIGRSAELNPALIARMAAEGHQVGGHTWSHPNLTTLTPEAVTEELRSTAAAIRAAGAEPSTVRAPYGALNEAVLAAFGTVPGSGSVTWTVDTRDWEHRSPARTLAAVRAAAAPGGIVLMHDVDSSSVDAVPAVIGHLRAEGYTFVTVDTLTGGVPSGSTVRGGVHP